MNNYKVKDKRTLIGGGCEEGRVADVLVLGFGMGGLGKL